MSELTDSVVEGSMQEVTWIEIADRGLLYRINNEIMHPLGLAVFYDPSTGVSEGAFVAPDGAFAYDEKTAAQHESLAQAKADDFESRARWLEARCAELSNSLVEMQTRLDDVLDECRGLRHLNAVLGSSNKRLRGILRDAELERSA